MDDLVARLREFRGGWKITNEAADEIERLRNQIALLEAERDQCGKLSVSTMPFGSTIVRREKRCRLPKGHEGWCEFP